jgi:hypothetical protein
LRLPYVRTTGTHGFTTPIPSADFDISTFMAMQMASYFASDGATISDDPCLEDASCAWLPQLGDSPGDTGDTGQPTDTGDSGDSGDTGQPVDSGDSGDTGLPVDSGDTADTSGAE